MIKLFTSKGGEVMKKLLASLVAVFVVFAFVSTVNAAPGDEIAKMAVKGKIIDLRMTNADNAPCWWGGSNTPPFYMIPNAIVADPAKKPWRNVWYSNTWIMDEHVGTHFDAPTHFIPSLSTGMKIATKYGDMYNESVPVEQFMGPAKVIDCTSLLGKAKPGKSPLISIDMVKDWEAKHGKLQPGDIVTFYTGYCPKYYKPFPAGDRMVYDVIEKGTAVGWPGPSPELAAWLTGEKGIKTLAGDIPSMGPWQVIRDTHLAGLGNGAIYVEQLMNLDKLPPVGAYFIFIPIKCKGASGGPGGALAIIP
jgi:kynurenine formamidase